MKQKIDFEIAFSLSYLRGHKNLEVMIHYSQEDRGLGGNRIYWPRPPSLTDCNDIPDNTLKTQLIRKWVKWVYFSVSMYFPL